MNTMIDRFSYPFRAGHKEATTSRDAARSITDIAGWQERILRMIKSNPATADEVAAALEISILHARPRISELRALHKIEDSGERRKNTSGHKAIVWKVTTCDGNVTTSASPSA